MNMKELKKIIAEAFKRERRNKKAKKGGKK